jgi:hypothetical protein
VGELKAAGEEEGKDQLDKRLAIADQLEVGGWLLEIDGDGAVLACRFGGLGQVSSPGRWWWLRMRHGGGTVLKWHTSGEYLGAPPLKSVECRTPVSGALL